MPLGVPWAQLESQIVAIYSVALLGLLISMSLHSWDGICRRANRIFGRELEPLSFSRPVGAFVEFTSKWTINILYVLGRKPKESPVLLRGAYGGVLLVIFVSAEVFTLSAFTGVAYAGYFVAGFSFDIVPFYQLIVAFFTVVVFSALCEANSRFDEPGDLV